MNVLIPSETQDGGCLTSRMSFKQGMSSGKPSLIYGNGQPYFISNLCVSCFLTTSPWCLGAVMGPQRYVIMTNNNGNGIYRDSRNGVCHY